MYRMLLHMACGASVMALLLGCSRDVGTKSTVHLKLPTSNDIIHQTVTATPPQGPTAGEGPAWNTSIVPATISEINCYAIFVGGKELNQNRCYNTTGSHEFRFGANTFAGFFRANEEVALEVPSGEGRIIYVTGTKSNADGCKKGALNSPAGPDFQKHSVPQVIGQSEPIKLDPGDNDVTIRVQLDTSRQFHQCDFIQGGGDSQLGRGLAFLQSDSTADAITPFDLAPTTAAPLRWNSFYGDDKLYDQGNANLTAVKVTQAGRYFAYNHYTVSSDVQRAMHNVQVGVNATAIPHFGVSGNYIRGTSGHISGSLGVPALLNLSQGDNVAWSVSSDSVGVAGTYTNGHSSFYMEHIKPERKVFAARATQTSSGTDFNPASFAGIEWIQLPDIDNTTYSHSNATNPEQITINETGVYFVSLNLPLSSSAQRAAPVVKLHINGSVVNGVMGANCYIRANASDTDCQLSMSTTFLANVGDVVTFEVVRAAQSGTVSLQSGRQGFLMMDKIDTSRSILVRGSNLESGSDWNTTAGSAVLWDNVDHVSTEIFEHDASASAQEIKVKKSGDYLVVYNGVMSSGVMRSNNEVFLTLNGINLDASKVTSHYIRNATGHTMSSGHLVYLLQGLNEGDLIEVKSRRAGAAGTVSAAYPARLAIIKKN